MTGKQPVTNVIRTFERVTRDARGTERKKALHSLMDTQAGFPGCASIALFMKTRKEKIFFVVGQDRK